MTPFGNAMRFIDGEEADWNFLQPLQDVVPDQPLRRQVQEPEGALLRAALDIPLRAVVDRAIQTRRRDSGLLQLRRLILHECDQRADDHARPLHRDRRKLIAQRFSASGRHDHRDVASGQNARYDGFLPGSKLRVAPVLPEQLEQIGRIHFTIVGGATL